MTDVDSIPTTTVVVKLSKKVHKDHLEHLLMAIELLALSKSLFSLDIVHDRKPGLEPMAVKMNPPSTDSVMKIMKMQQGKGGCRVMSGAIFDPPTELPMDFHAMTLHEKLNTRVRDLPLSVRLKNALSLDFGFVGELVQAQEKALLRVPNLGLVSMNELKQFLWGSMELQLEMTVPDWNPPEKTR